MIHSMTAFASKTVSGEWGQATCEIKSINSRYLECNFRLPEFMRSLEIKFRDRIRKQLHRGKVECSIRVSLNQEAEGELKLNIGRVNQLNQIANLLNEHIIAGKQLSASEYLQWPGVVESEDLDLSSLEANFLELVSLTAADLVQARAREGEQLQMVISERLKGIKDQIAIVKEQLPKALLWQQAKLKERFSEAGLQFDQERLEQELVLLANKIDIAEELDRLSTHILEVERALNEGGQVGRRLDFLMQELNREANTMASKSINTDITAAAIEIKVLIEQMREQIQNLE